MKPKNPHAIDLPEALLEQWREAVLIWGKPGKGIPRSAPQDEKIHYVIKGLSDELMDLWEAYNTERDRLGKVQLTKKSTILAYMLGFHLPGTARFSLVWKRLAERFDLSAITQSRLIVQDFGSGTGAMTHALQHCLGHQADALYHLSDARGGFLDASRLIFGDDPKIKTHKATLESLKPEYYRLREKEVGIYLAGYVWNELQNNPKAKRVFENILHGPLERAEPVLTFILEPANERPARAAMEMRDSLTGAGWVPVYPCPHALPCPMREKPKDRCYTDGGWERPPEVKQLDRILGTDRRRISTAGYVFASPAAQALLKPHLNFKGVTVGLPTTGPNKGPDAKRTRLLCTEDGKIVRSDYHPGSPRDRGLPNR